MTAVRYDADFMRDTGPVDFYDPDDPVVRQMAREDANGNLHDARGRFTAKTVEYRHLVQFPDEPGVDRPWTLAELESFGEFGPDYTGPHVTLWDWPDEGPAQEATAFSLRTETLIDGSTRVTYSDGRVSIVLRGNGLDTSRVLYPGDPGYDDRVGLMAVDPELDRAVRAAHDAVAERCRDTHTSGPDKGRQCAVRTTWRSPADPTVPKCHHHGGKKY